MKKLLTVLTITAIAMTSIFAKSAQVQLVNTIDETPLTYVLAYGDTEIKDGTEDFKIVVAPLTQDGHTELFTVRSNSNLNRDLGVKVVVSPSSFMTTLNGDDDYDSEIVPAVNTKVKVDSISAGQNLNLLVNSFNLSWKGDDTLPAGDYVSNVKIEYTIE